MKYVNRNGIGIYDDFTVLCYMFEKEKEKNVYLHDVKLYLSMLSSIISIIVQVF